MADVTGGTPPTNASPFAVPADITEVYDHFGDAAMFAVANAAALPASGNWAGRLLTTTDTGNLYRWSGSAWQVVGGSVVSELPTMSTGFTPNVSYPVKVTRIGRRCTLEGVVNFATGGVPNTAICTVSAGFRPASLQFIGFVLSNGASDFAGMLHVSTTGVITIPDAYRTGSLANGDFIPMVGSWSLD